MDERCGMDVRINLLVTQFAERFANICIDSNKQVRKRTDILRLGKSCPRFL